jgi:hypothetical protein
MYFLLGFFNIYEFFFGIIPPKDTYLLRVATFVEKNKKRFLKTFEDDAKYNYINVNIEPELYDSEKLSLILQKFDNTIEKRWKSNILMQQTPNGTCVMCYDIYKNGFSYYADTFLPNSVLNSVAMKYVMTYQCRDFFLDERALPEGHRKMPILQAVLKTEDTNGKSTSSCKKKNTDENFKDAFFKETNSLPFAKLKQFQSISANNGKDGKSGKDGGKGDAEDLHEYQTNKFIYLGKICNFQPLKKEKIVKKTTISSYSEYKQKMAQTTYEPLFIEEPSSNRFFPEL